MTVYHVRPRDDGKWEIKKRGAERASFTGSRAKMLSKSQNVVEEGDTRVVHDADGSVIKREKVEETDYGRSNMKKNVRRKMGDSPFDF